MPESTRSFLFPDIDVWIALTYDGHVHHSVAATWFDTIGQDSRFFFCRFTQLGFLRLLTAEAVMGGRAMNQSKAWEAYDVWLEDDRVAILEEPPGLERIFRAFSQDRRPAPKDWADSYLCAFAEAAHLCIVTFDRALGARAETALVLKL